MSWGFVAIGVSTAVSALQTNQANKEAKNTNALQGSEGGSAIGAVAGGVANAAAGGAAKKGAADKAAALKKEPLPGVK
jgi:hypothetical protein